MAKFSSMLCKSLTTNAVSPVLMISMSYPIHIGLEFYPNKKWSFNHGGSIFTLAFSHLISYMGCYVLNVAVLKFFSGHVGYSHLVILTIAIIPIALLLFLAQEYCVFNNRNISIVHVQL